MYSQTSSVPRGRRDIPREQSDKVLLFVILYVEYHVLKPIGETRVDGEGFFGIADTDSSSQGKGSLHSHPGADCMR